MEATESLDPEEISHLIATGELTISKQHSGPLPPAEDVALYEQTLPGAAERIFAYMEREQAFRHDHARREQASLVRETDRGQLFGFVIMAGSLAAGVASFLFDAPQAVTIVFVSVPIISAVKAFIEGRQKP